VTTRLGRQRRRRPADEIRAVALDAAEACFIRFGIEQTTIDDIVRAAGIPRATLYRHAGGRDDLLIAVILAEIDRVLARLSRYIATRTTLADIVVDGTLEAIKLVRQNPLLSVFASGPAVIGATISEQALAGLLQRLRGFVEPIFEPAQRAGLLRGDLSVPDAVEYLVRTIESQLSFEAPWRRTAAQQREYLRQTLLPVFIPDDALATGHLLHAGGGSRQGVEDWDPTPTESQGSLRWRDG